MKKSNSVHNTNNSKKTVCSACINISGGCCVGVNFNVHKSEAEPFLETEKNGGFPQNHSFKQEKDDKDQYLYNSGEERCIYLNESNVCSIYEKRPLICRLYPILWKKDKYFIDLICPLVHWIPLREIAKWPSQKKNKDMMVHMDELDFDGRSRQYVNLKTLHSMNDALEIVKDDELEV